MRNKDISFVRRVLNSIVTMLGANTVSTIASFINSYATATILGPALVGTWQTARVAIQYAGLTGLSLPFVVRRELPQLRGDGRESEAQEIASVVFTYGIFASFLSAFVIVVIALLANDSNFTYCMVISAAIVLIQIFNGYGNIINKGLNNYSLLSKLQLIQSGITVLIIPVIYFLKLHAILWGTLFINMVLAWAYYNRVPYGYHYVWNPQLLKKLILIALPLFFADASSIVFSSIDRVIIAKFASFEDVGFYSLSNLVNAPLTLIAGTASLVIFTHLNERHGKDTSKEVIRQHIDIPLSILSKGMPVLVGFGMLLLPLVVSLVLPKFAPGIEAAQISMIGIFYLSTAGFASNALFIMNKQKQSAIAFFAAGLLNTILSTAAIIYGFGIVGVAASTSFAFLIYNTILLYLVLSNIRESNVAIIKMIFLYNLPMVVIILLIFLLKIMQNHSFLNIWGHSILLNTILSVCLFALFTVPFILQTSSRVLFITRR